MLHRSLRSRFASAAILFLSLAYSALFSTRWATAADSQSLHEKIDLAIAARAQGPVAGTAEDDEFVRRVYLDLAGIIPVSEEAVAFGADADPAKREKLIDRLLAAPQFGRRMQEFVSSMLLERRTGSAVTDAEWNQYLRDSFNANKPWHEFTRELLFADDSEQLKPARKFFGVVGRDKNPHQMTQDVARLFLGRSVMCAQCHDHPNVATYSQADYFGLFSYLQEKPEQAKTPFESVFVAGKKETFPRLPGKDQVVIPTFTKEQADEAKAFRPRLLLARDLPTADNELFKRNSVNRLWFLMLGRGLVHPLDLHHDGNAPSHPELLTLLANDFAGHGFDVKYLLREIALSQTYQRASRLPEGTKGSDVAPASYRIFNPKPLSPEQLAWSMLRATGNLPAFEKAAVPQKPDFGWYNYINGRIASPPSNVPDVLDLFVGVFGNPPGEAEVEFNPSMGQALFVLNERLILGWLEPRDGNLMHRVGTLTDKPAIVKQLYLAILSRAPTDPEIAIASEFLAAQPTRSEQTLADLAWALLASDEFRMNH